MWNMDTHRNHAKKRKDPRSLMLLKHTKDSQDYVLTNIEVFNALQKQTKIMKNHQQRKR